MAPQRPMTPQRGTAKPAPPATPSDAIPARVRATRLGYYDHKRRREGDVFTLADSKKEFSERWMEYVSDDLPERITTGKQALQQFHDETLAGKSPTGAADVLS